MSDFSKLEGYNVKDAYARNEIAQMKINFQDGVDTIYNAIVAQGVTPSSSTPSDCATAITQIGTTQYNNGRSQGRKDIGENAQVISPTMAGTSQVTISDIVPNHYYIITIRCLATSDPVAQLSNGADLISSYYSNFAYTASSGVKRYVRITTFFVKSTSNQIVIATGGSFDTHTSIMDLGLCQ